LALFKEVTQTNLTVFAATSALVHGRFKLEGCFV